MAEPIPVERRKDVFAALVAAQDTGLDVATSRKQVAAQFGLTGRTVEKIETGGWPPSGRRLTPERAAPATASGSGLETPVSWPQG